MTIKNTEQKITRRDALSYAIDIATDEKMKEKLQSMLDGENRKSSKKSKAKSEEREQFEKMIFDVFDNQPQKLFTLIDIAKIFDYEYSTQKISGAVNSLEEQGKVNRTKQPKGKRVIFQRA